MSAPLRDHHNAVDLLHLRVVRGRHSIQEARDLHIEDNRVSSDRLYTVTYTAHNYTTAEVIVTNLRVKQRRLVH